MKNLPIYDKNINLLIQGYFNLYFYHTFLKSKYRSSKSKRLSMNKIFVSKAEIKHTNHKAIITVYVYNREKIALLKKIRNIKKILKVFLKKQVLLIKIFEKLLLQIAESSLMNSGKSYNNEDIMKIYEKLPSPHNLSTTYLNKELTLLRKYKLRLNLNKYKFEGKLLYKLTKLISKLYNKRVEFNIINLKSIILNSDLFTKILSLKLKNKKANVIRMMNIILNKVILPKVNRIKEKSILVKSIDFNLLENKYKNININSILGLQSLNLDKLLNELYYNSTFNKDYTKIYEILFNSMRYKNMGGTRLEVKGRLTKRYRADRAIFKVR